MPRRWVLDGIRGVGVRSHVSGVESLAVSEATGATRLTCSYESYILVLECISSLHHTGEPFNSKSLKNTGLCARFKVTDVLATPDFEAFHDACLLHWTLSRPPAPK